MTEADNGFWLGFRISGSGMRAQQVRMNTISSNIANVNTVRTSRRWTLSPQGDSRSNSRRKDIWRMLNHARKFKSSSGHRYSCGYRGSNLRHEPDHPDADEKGMVAYPNVNLMEEMAI